MVENQYTLSSLLWPIPLLATIKNRQTRKLVRRTSSRPSPQVLNTAVQVSIEAKQLLAAEQCRDSAISASEIDLKRGDEPSHYAHNAYKAVQDMR